MKKIDSFINLYPQSKTLQFSLKPYGKTADNFIQNNILKRDNERAIESKKVKRFIDKFHKKFIDDVLSDVNLDISEYAELFFKNSKSSKEKEKMVKLEEEYRMIISKALKSPTKYNDLFTKKMIEEMLPNYLTENDELKSVSMFKKFSTFLEDFQKNRENMYTYEDKSTGIAHRCINDNLPKFLDNVKVFEKILGELNEADFQKIDCLCTELTGRHIEKLFCVDNFRHVLTSGGIESYNDVIGGYTRENGTKEKGINEIINLSNQKLSRNERLPKMKMLYKQILADRESISFIPETFSSDDELLNAVKEYYTEFICRMLDKLEGLFSDLSAFDLSGIYLKNGSAVCDLSNKVLGYWYVIKEQWNEEYSAVKKIKDYDKFAEERSKK